MTWKDFDLLKTKKPALFLEQVFFVLLVDL